MSFKVFLVILSTLLLAHSQATSVGRIYGDKTAPDGQFPFQISLRLNGTHICGGSILSDLVILTAASCVAAYKNDWMSLPVSYFQVHAGSNDVFSGGVLVNVAAIEMHRLYSNRLNDLALLKLAEPLIFSERIQPIEMDEEEISPGTDVIISGWETLSNLDDVPDLLQYNVLQTISKNKCFAELGLRYNFLLCMVQENGNGMCESDAGGPVVYNGKLVGVAANPKNGCGIGSPDVSASIAYYHWWIVQEMSYFERH